MLASRIHLCECEPDLLSNFFVNVILSHVLPLLLPMTAAANSHQLRDAIR